MEPSVEQDTNGLDTVVAWLAPASEDFIYNVPDAYEQDPDIIRAELMFFSNPQSQAFSGEAYYALKNVQDQCQVDYQKFCAQSYLKFDDAQAMMDKMFSISLPFLMNRRLRETGESISPDKYSGRKLLQFMRSFYVPKETENDKSSAVKKENSTPTGKASLHLEKAGKADLRNAHSTVGPHSHLMRGTGNTNLARMIKHSADPRRRLHASLVMPGFARDNTMSDSVEIASDIQLLARMDPQIPLVDPMPHKGFASPRNEEPGRDRPRPPPPPGPHDPHPPPPPGPHDPHPPPPPGPHDPHPPHPPVPPHNHDSDSDSDDEDGDEDDASPKKHHQHHPHHSDEPREERHQLEDSYFAGSLGFGASGDYCLYENVQDLSPPCAQAIGNVYALREQYWTSYNEAQEAGHHHHPVFGLFIIGFFLVILLKKIMHAPRRRQVHKFLTALNEQPELKAQLESQLNMDIPKPRTRTCCGGERRSCLRRLFFALGYIVFAFVASVFIAVTSLEMTAGIVDGMESGAPEDAPPASPFFVLSILMLIVVGQLILLRVAMRTVGRLWHNHCGATIEDNAGQFNDGGSSSPTANNGTGGNGLQVEFQRLASLPVSFYREYVSPRVSSLFTTRAAVSEGYAPLRSGEDEREMIAVGRHVTPSSHGQPTQYAVYTGVPINPSNVVHITARPVSSVNLV